MKLILNVSLENKFNKFPTYTFSFNTVSHRSHNVSVSYESMANRRHLGHNEPVIVSVDIVMKSLFSFGISVIDDTCKISHSSDDSHGSISGTCSCYFNI